jgi:segregation and condensation protein B
MTTIEPKLLLEAALLAAREPLPIARMQLLFDEALEPETLQPLLEALQADWAGRGVELIEVAGGWRFQTRPDYQSLIDRLSAEKPPRYSRAVMETLAIIAYRQPVTRGDIEDIRGVVVTPNVIRTLEERGWIDAVGHRETPGRPALYATTRAFLDDLGLRSLQELPPLEEIANHAAVLESRSEPTGPAPDPGSGQAEEPTGELPLDA